MNNAWILIPGGLVVLGLVGFVGCGGAGSSTIDGSGTGSNGGVATNGGVNPADAGPGGNTGSLSCGNATCAIPAEVCCLTPTSGGVAYGCETGKCAIPDAGLTQGDDGGAKQADINVVTLGCSAQANCAAGSVCCATRSDATGTVSSCQVGTSCGNGNGGRDGIQLCDPAAPAASNGCPTGQQCISDNIRDLGLPTTFGRCKKP
jgi:hypothetical protein